MRKDLMMGKHRGEQYPSRWTAAFLREQHAAYGKTCKYASCNYEGKHRA